MGSIWRLMLPDLAKLYILCCWSPPVATGCTLLDYKLRGSCSCSEFFFRSVDEFALQTFPKHSPSFSHDFSHHSDDVPKTSKNPLREIRRWARRRQRKLEINFYRDLPSNSRYWDLWDYVASFWSRLYWDSEASNFFSRMCSQPT